MPNESSKRTIRLAIFLLVIQASSALAQVPEIRVGSSRESSHQPDQPCVLLRNDNVLFGHADQLGEYIVVRKEDGSELQLPRQQVACWAASLRDLYRYRVDHRPNNHVATRLKDAQWCVRYDLHDLATAELAAIRKVDPRNRQALRIQQQIDRLASNSARRIPLVNRAETAGSSEPTTTSPELGGMDLSVLQHFASSVQPTLLNRCGHCHSHTSDRPFSLLVPSPGSRPSARITQENLAFALRHVDTANPEQSELLVKATVAHGNSDVPLEPRHGKSIHALRHWIAVVSTVQANSGSSRPRQSVDLEIQGSTASVMPAAHVAERPAEGSASLGLPGTGQAESEAAKRTSMQISSQSPLQPIGTSTVPGVGTAPARLPRVVDPFSPDLFNRRHHARAR